MFVLFFLARILWVKREHVWKEISSSKHQSSDFREFCPGFLSWTKMACGLFVCVSKTSSHNTTPSSWQVNIKLYFLLMCERCWTFWSHKHVYRAFSFYTFSECPSPRSFDARQPMPCTSAMNVRRVKGRVRETHGKWLKVAQTDESTRGTGRFPFWDK